jgi:hypothetical protein
MPLVKTTEYSCISVIIDREDSSILLEKTHTDKVFHFKIVCLVLVVFEYIFLYVVISL